MFLALLGGVVAYPPSRTVSFKLFFAFDRLAKLITAID